MDSSIYFKNIKNINIASVLSFVKLMELTDIYTKNHSFQVAELAFLMGKFIGLSEKELMLIKLAGLLHDIGKIVIPEEIFNKPGSLNKYEWDIMKQHPKKGSDMIKTVDGLKEVKQWILYHHEKYDGTGYPEGLKKEEIPFCARILAVCDSYSAMVSDRPYKKSISEEDAKIEIQECKGKQFDPELADVFLKLPCEYVRRAITK
ncbi:MAG: HD-GYP domain-containing protein [candidate division WOR-3 bacterium]